MKLMELLTGQTSTTPTTSPISPTAAMVQPQAIASSTPGTTPGQSQPMKTAGIGDMISNFMTTPQPIGGGGGDQKPGGPSAIAQSITNATPAFGQINQALQGAQPKPQQ